LPIHWASARLQQHRTCRKTPPRSAERAHPIGFIGDKDGKHLLDKRITERRGSPLLHWPLQDLRQSFTIHL